MPSYLRWGVQYTIKHKELVLLTFLSGLFTVAAQFFVVSPGFSVSTRSYATPGLLLLIAGWVAEGLVVIAIFIVALDDVEADTTRPWSEILGKSVRLLPSVAVTYIIIFVSTIIGLFLFILPGIYIGLRLFPALPAAVVDTKIPIDSHEAGWQVTSEKLETVFGLGLLYLGLTRSVSLSVPAVLSSLGPVPLTLLSTAINAFIAPVFWLALGYFYIFNRSKVDQGETEFYQSASTR